MKKKTTKPKKTIWLKYGDKWVTIGELEKRLDNFFESLKKHEKLFMDYSEKISQLKYRIEQLESHEENAIRILESIDNRIKFLEKLEIHNSTNEFAEDVIKVNQQKYKVGDYVVLASGDIGKIHKIQCEDYIIEKYGTLYRCEKKHILGYAKQDLLTPEEKEYLSAVIKPFGRDLYITKLVSDDLKIDNKDVRLLLIDASFMFKNLEINKEYNLQELGL